MSRACIRRFRLPCVRENHSTLWHPELIVHVVDRTDMREVCWGSENVNPIKKGNTY